MKIAVNLLIFIFVLVLVATAMLYSQQRRLLFPAQSDYPRAALPGFRLVHTRTDDGLRLAAFYRPAAPGRKTLLFFKGNGNNMICATEAPRAQGEEGEEAGRRRCGRGMSESCTKL